jgi:hypothetical protein
MTDQAIDFMQILVNRGINYDLCVRVHEGLYKKRQGQSVVEIDLDKMCGYYDASREDLVTIIRWYESNLLSTTFIIN